MNEAKFNDVSENKPPSSKGKGSSNIFKVALHLLRKKKGGLKSNNKSKSTLSASTNTALNKIIGSVRPLYLQNGVGDDLSPSPPHSANKTLFTLTPRESGVGQEEAAGVVVMSPNRYEPSPCHSSYSIGSTSSSSSSRSFSSGGMSSKYASAQSLYDLDNHEDDVIDEEKDDDDDDDGDAYYDGLVGDELIDVKAELFITNFYQQMRIQD